ncbi:MAG: hypothetical protein KJO28_06830, partial [Desulfofustis sp.]|nr:hypothetical protein [Desulfofustis sp.]
CSSNHTMMMGQDACSGGQTPDTLFDINGDELLSSTDSIALFDLGASSQVSGFVTTNAVAAPVIMSSAERDFVYIPKQLDDEEREVHDDNASHSIWYPPGVEKTVTRGKNLGLYYWRELF